jgi:hypothetical protein
MAVISHPPYYLDLAPCDFFIFPKMKLKLKDRRFETIEEIQAESQRVLDTDRKGLPGSMTGVYMREGTTSRVMAVDRPCDESCDLYSVILGYLGFIFVLYQYT